jgi:hypothetical protein
MQLGRSRSRIKIFTRSRSRIKMMWLRNTGCKKHGLSFSSEEKTFSKKGFL